MISRSGGLKPRAVAGRPSVTRLTQSSWTGIRASGRPRMAVRKMLEKDSEGDTHTEVSRGPQADSEAMFVPKRVFVPHQTTSPTLEEMRYLMNCFMLL